MDLGQVQEEIDIDIDEILSSSRDQLPAHVDSNYIEESKLHYAFIHRYKHHIKTLKAEEDMHITDIEFNRGLLQKWEQMKDYKIKKLEALNRRIQSNNEYPRMVDIGPLEKKRDVAFERLKIFMEKIEHVKSENASSVKALKKVFMARNSIKQIYQAFLTGQGPENLQNNLADPAQITTSVTGEN